MTTLDKQYDHWCDEDESFIHRMFSNQPEKLKEALSRLKMARTVLDAPRKSDTYYWELKALQEKCEAFVNSVYDDYQTQTIIDYVHKALYSAEIGNLKP